MFELFSSMMKEEWRIHSTVFGSISFALFPVMIFGIAFMSSFLLPLFKEIIPVQDLITITHLLFMLLGLMVGAFGLLGAEVMNRRFGQASLLAYASRTLPISEKRIFLTFVIKDTVYYFILWVFPFVLGFACAAPLIKVSPIVSLILAVTLILAFLTGLSLAFFLSAVYTRSKRLLLLLLLLGGIGLLICNLLFQVDLYLILLPAAAFSSHSTGFLIGSLILIILLSFGGTILFNPEYTHVDKHFHNTYVKLCTKYAWWPFSLLVAKDILDLSRSGGIVGQTLFSFLLPLGIIWLFLSILAPFITVSGVILLLAVLTGIIGSTIYTWLTQFDTFGAYATLPIEVSTIMKGKISSFSLMQVIPILFLICVTILAGRSDLLIPVVILGISLSFWGLSVTVFLTGLSPSVLVYDVKVLAAYLVLTGIGILPCLIVSAIHPWYAVGSLLLGIPAYGLIRSGFKRWDSWDNGFF